MQVNNKLFGASFEQSKKIIDESILGSLSNSVDEEF